MDSGRNSYYHRERWQDFVLFEAEFLNIVAPTFKRKGVGWGRQSKLS